VIRKKIGQQQDIGVVMLEDMQKNLVLNRQEIGNKL
jgi:hypothetical protein